MSNFFVKQPAEQYAIAIEFSGKLPSGATLSSGVVLAADMTAPAGSTTLAAAAVPGATTLSLTAHPGEGAFLTLNPNGSNQELVHVTTVTGSGPFTATILGTVTKSHAGGEAVSYQPGVTGEVLVSGTATITGTQALATVKAGVHGRRYKLTVYVTLSTGHFLEEDLDMSVVNQ